MRKQIGLMLAVPSLILLLLTLLLVHLAASDQGEKHNRSDALPPMQLAGTVRRVTPGILNEDDTYLYVEVTSCNWDSLPQPGETACLVYTPERLEGPAPAAGDAITALVDKDMVHATIEGASQNVVIVYSIRTIAYTEEQQQAEQERRQDYEKNRKTYEELDRRLKEQVQAMQSPQLG